MSGPARARSAGMLRSTAVFSAMTLVSRVAGYVRDYFQATVFGASAAVSAFVIAYRIPNYLRRIFAEGSFSSAFVPVLSELRQQGDEQALQDFLDHVAGALLAAVLAVTGLGILLAPWIARLFLLLAGDEQQGLVDATADMLRITFPYLTFISMTALAGAILNSFRQFGLPALAPVLHNLAIIFAILVARHWFDVPEQALAWGVVAAGVLQFVLLWSALGRGAMRPRFRFSFRHPQVTRVWKLMLPTVFSSSVSQINLLVGTMFAGMLVAEAQSWLYYSDRLTELPLGLFGVAIGTVILPQLSRQHADKDAAGYSRSLDWGLRMVMLVGLPAALGLSLLSLALTSALFRYDAFTAEDARMVGLSLTAMSVGIPAFMLSKVLLPAFYARQDTRTPMRIAVQTVAVNVLLTMLLVTPLDRAGLREAHVGIAAATAIAGIYNCLALWRAVRREGLYTPEPGWGRWFGRILLALAVMTPAVLGVEAWLVAGHGDWPRMAREWRWIGLLLTVAAGAGAYAATLVATGLRPRHLRH